MPPSPSTPSPIVVIGACNTDLISYVPRLPKAGETIHGRVDPPGFGFGGKGANQAVMARRMGGPVDMISCVGADFYGRETLANFDANGVRTAHVAVSETSVTGQATITVDADGRNTIVIANGANDRLTIDDIDAAGPAIARACVVVGQLELEAEATLRAFQLATECKVPTFLNTAPAKTLADIPAVLLEHTDAICANEPEAELLTEIDPSLGDLDAREAAEKLVRLIRGRIAVITLGERGCVVARKDKKGPWSYDVTCEIVPLPAALDNGDNNDNNNNDNNNNDKNKNNVTAGGEEGGEHSVKVVDTTGAGDCWMGAFTYFYFASSSGDTVIADARGEQRVGMAAEEAARRACAIATMSVQRKGTQSSYPAHDDPRLRALKDTAGAPSTPSKRG